MMFTAQKLKPSKLLAEQISETGLDTIVSNKVEAVETGLSSEGDYR